MSIGPTTVPPVGLVIVSVKLGVDGGAVTASNVAPHVRGSLMSETPVGLQSPLKPL